MLYQLSYFRICLFYSYRSLTIFSLDLPCQG
jgi:hypothetical protein